MVDGTFTDEVYDTWLGSMLAADLWYPLWDASHISQTASALVEVITGQVATLNIPTTPSSNNVLSSSDSSKNLGTPKQVKETDYDAAWSLLTKPAFASLPSTLSTVLEELGISSASDLSSLEDEATRAFLPSLMKPVQQSKLKDVLGTHEVPKPVKEANYDAAWSLLSKPAFASLPSTLSTMFEELGITSASDLSSLEDEATRAFLPNLMKPIQRTKLREALGYN